MGRANISSQGKESLGPHSQLLQAWAEAGLLGLMFFLYFGRLLVQGLWLLVFRRPLDVMTPLYLYYLLVGAWNLLLSPFTNLHRFDIGLALIIIIQVLRERPVFSRFQNT
jgi:O-antigen ligase